MTKDTNTALPKTLFPFIWHFLKEHKMIVYMVVFLSIIAGFWGPLNSVLIKQLIDLLPSVNDGNVAVLAIPASLIVINFIVFDNFTWRSVNYIWAKYVPVVQKQDHCRDAGLCIIAISWFLSKYFIWQSLKTNY